jgi:ABC-2 type transport system permease protein
MSGFGAALRLIWRRNRWFWCSWIVGIVAVLPATASKYRQLVPAGTDSATFLNNLGANPTMRSILGLPFDLTTAGGFTFWRVGTFAAACAALMALLAMIRTTRAEEEAGRWELLRAGAMDRHAPLLASLLANFVAAALLAASCAAALLSANTPAAGATAAGLGIGLTATVFAAVGAVVAQLFTSARAARAWGAGVVLGGMYLLRGILDGSPAGRSLGWLRWSIPLEWPSLVRPYAHERWWVLLLPLATTAILSWLAVALEARRDHGSGLLPQRNGPATAAPGLSGVGGLAWRLQRPTLLGWLVGLGVAALGLGSLGRSLNTLTAGNANVADMFRKMGGGASQVEDAFYVAMVGICATLAALCAVMAVNRLRAEETSGRAEWLLSTPTGRRRFAMAFWAPALSGAAACLLLAGALLPALAGGGTRRWWTTFSAALVLTPGIVVIAGLALAILGWAPRWFALAWAVVGWSVLATWIGPLFNAPNWLIQLQPFGHLPHLPVDQFSWLAVTLETLLGAGLAAFGLVGYRRRDIPT